MSDLRAQMRHRDKEMVPKFLVQAMFGLMISTTAIVAYAQFADVPDSGVLIEAPIVSERIVTLTGDRARVYTVRDGDEIIATSAGERDGFIGVIGIVIERNRMLSGISMDAPLRIVLRDNGHVAIIDDETNEVIELIGYGVDNVAAFADLLN